MVCEDCSNVNFVVLFTMYNTKEREKMYNDIIEYWLSDCKFPKEKIFIVDSANRGIDSSIIPLKNQVIFDQKVECQIGENKSNTELYSLKKAINTLDFGNTKYVFKITGKYKLPQLCGIKLHSDLILQNMKLEWLYNIFPMLKNINSEIIGFRKDLFKYILNGITQSKGLAFEKRLNNFVHKNKNITVQYLPKLINDARYNRGDKTYLSYL